MSKVLVFSDKEWEKFLFEITWDSALRDQDFESHPTLVDIHQISQAVADKLLKHELKGDVIEFKAEIGIPFWDFHLSLPKCDREHMAEIPKRFKLKEKVRVFVVKKGEK